MFCSFFYSFFFVLSRISIERTVISLRTASAFSILGCQKSGRKGESDLIGPPLLSMEPHNTSTPHFFSYLTMNSFVETMTKQHIWESDEWKALQEAVPGIKEQHLRQLLQVNSILPIHLIGREAF